MLMEALPSVMGHDPLVIPSRSCEDVSGVTGHNPVPSRAPCSALTWKYRFSCTRLSLDRILLMVILLLLIPPRPVEVRGHRGQSSLRYPACILPSIKPPGFGLIAGRREMEPGQAETQEGQPWEPRPLCQGGYVSWARDQVVASCSLSGQRVG